MTRSKAINRLLMLCSLALIQTVSAQELQVTLVDGDGEPVSDVVIELLLPESLRSEYAESNDSSVDQVDKEFVPTVTTIVAGSRVSFPNSDDILHHVYSFSPAREFNIPLYGMGENDDYLETFPTPGVVEIGCNIHDWMLAYIYVGESNQMAVSGEDGIAVLASPPAGEFQLKVWHSRLRGGEMLTERVSLGQGQTTEVSLSLDLQRDRRVRRAPSSNRKRYR